MRMRRRSNLEQKIADCGEWLLFSEPYEFFKVEEKDRFNLIDYKKVFGNDNPVELEIGCGKGDFIIQNAKLHPDVNYIAVEKISNVIILGLKRAFDEKIPNLRFLNVNACNLNYYLPENSIGKVYLNFSCPYPKYTYRNHRLTNSRFLKVYEKFLTRGAEIWQKTDNMHFFEYSIAELSSFGFTITEVQLDLHRSDFVGNIETEYEKLFSSKGQPIYRLVAKWGKEE